MFTFYLFENEADLLDKLDKIGNIIIATFTLIFSIYIWYVSNHKENKKEVTNRKVEFLKTIVLDNNLTYFFQFHDQILLTLSTFRNRTLSNADRTTINLLLIDELEKFRLKFYDLLFPIDRSLYDFVKNNSDTLIDDLTIKVFDPLTDHFENQAFENSIVNTVIESRNRALEAIVNVK